MKKLAIIATAASALIGGCAVYDAPVTEGGAYYQGSGYYSGTPYYGQTYYTYPTYTYGPHYTYSYSRGPVYYPNARDRDGDGVRNRYDASPNNPYRQ